MIRYDKKPFLLTNKQIDWVESTYADMTIEEKIGQLFCPIVFTKEENQLKELVQTRHIRGMLYREGPGKE